MTTKPTATAHDNRTDRVALMLDTARPYVAVKPAGFTNRVIGHYATFGAARKAAARWNPEGGK